jgi:hypothetical protein
MTYLSFLKLINKQNKTQVSQINALTIHEKIWFCLPLVKISHAYSICLYNEIIKFCLPISGSYHPIFADLYVVQLDLIKQNTRANCNHQIVFLWWVKSQLHSVQKWASVLQPQYFRCDLSKVSILVHTFRYWSTKVTWNKNNTNINISKSY